MAVKAACQIINVEGVKKNKSETETTTNLLYNHACNVLHRAQLVHWLDPEGSELFNRVTKSAIYHYYYYVT